MFKNCLVCVCVCHMMRITFGTGRDESLVVEAIGRELVQAIACVSQLDYGFA